MQRERFIVKYVTANNCFAQLSTTWLRRLETEENAIEVLHNERIYYLSCIPRINADEMLCIGATFARNLHIQEGDEVLVSSLKNAPSLSSVRFVPRTINDRELLELQMEKVQSNLLSQIRIVAKGQPVVAWISKFSSITFTVEDLEPKFTYGLLKQFTEVHVLNAAENTRKDKEIDSKLSSLNKVLSYFSKRKDCRDPKDNAANYALLQSFRDRSALHVFRVYPLPECWSFNQSNAHDMILRCPYHVLIPRKCLPKDITSTRGPIMCKIRKVPESRQYVNITSTNFLNEESFFPKSPQELTAKLYVLENILEKCSASLDRNYFALNSIHSCVYTSASMRNTLKLKIGSRVVLQTVAKEGEWPKPSSVSIFPSDQSVTTKVFENYVKFHSKHETLLLNSCSTIVLDDGKRCVVQMSPAECDCTMIDEKDMENIIVHIRPVLPSDTEIPENHPKKSVKPETLSVRCIENILGDCKISLDLSLGLRSMNFLYDRENILICGNLGSGKTTICGVLIERYRKESHFVYTHMIDCRSLKGKKVEAIQKIITSAISECVYYQPSVLFLDDLESITNASLNDEENTIDSTNASRITDMLLNTVTQYQRFHYISIIATCIGVNKIGLKLRPTREAQFFRTVLNVPILEKVDRIDILRLTLEDKLCVHGDMNWNYYGNKTEGWMPQDLVDLAERAKFVAWKRHVAEKSKPPIIMTEEDVNTALKDYTPMSLQDIQLYKSGDHSWSDIGGLAEIKRSLTEILQWPLKYPEIFKNAPIKLQSGVLLYGMPGTGKTMLAKAIAGECDVNLISIKGPELLSKYIGVSEESVRNVFERARRAKPCVLFFDEFDSLAPRRGHDSTGVTDRVVNQLLTQLDGVEDREGVAVVAASSRPDLLDPALLRPGRLDKCLHCPIPSETEREAIFKILSRAQNIDTAKLNLKELAQLSAGFTGADINAAVTMARLSVLEHVLGAKPDGKVEATDVRVTQMHLVESIKSTEPSLSTAEILKYNEIYKHFRLSKEYNSSENMIKTQKATLA